MPTSRSAPDSSFKSLRNRRANARDAAKLAEWIIEDLPVSHRLIPVLALALHGLLADERIFGVCVEEAITRPWPDPAERRPVAFGLSTFLSDDCATMQVASPQPFFWLELLERTWRQKDSLGFLTLDDLARANAGDGCNLLPFLWIQRPKDASSPKGAHLLTRAMRSLLDDHRGYNLKSIVKEAGREHEEAFTRGGLRKVRSSSLNPEILGNERLLFRLTRNEAQHDAFGTSLSLLFDSARPRCGFSRIQQHVLICAADDMSDDEIADQLRVTTHAINMRWRTIYDRIEQQEDLATLIYSDKGHGNGNGSGAQKRRRVVAYVRSHPEELRPYAWG